MTLATTAQLGDLTPGTRFGYCGRHYEVIAPSIYPGNKIAVYHAPRQLVVHLPANAEVELWPEWDEHEPQLSDGPHFWG